MTSITKKQYLLSSRRMENLDMVERRIGEYYLYTDGQLNISKAMTADGKEVFLLGNAFCMDEAGKSVISDIEGSTEAELKGATGYWTGRWALLSESFLLTDACALMSAFYIVSDGEFYVSSSLALITAVLGLKTAYKVSKQGLTWHFVPDTVVEGVSALVSTEIMKFDGKSVITEFFDWTVDYRGLSTSEKCEKVADLLVNGVKNIHLFSGKDIVLALTGGKDSRVTFSALVKSGVPFVAYTAEHGNISSSDKSVPEKLSKCFGTEHRYVKKGKFDSDKLEDYLRFTNFNSNGADAEFYSYGQFEKFPKDSILIRSGLYEAGQTYSRGLFQNNVESLRNGIANYYGLLADSLQGKAYDRWIAYVKNNPIDKIDLRDRLYIEQRAGGWVSAIEQSLDINDFTSIQIANSCELLSVLLSCNDEERGTLALSYETIRLLAPEALRFDVNKTTLGDKLTLVKQVAKNPVVKVKKLINKIRRRKN